MDVYEILRFVLDASNAMNLVFVLPVDVVVNRSVDRVFPRSAEKHEDKDDEIKESQLALCNVALVNVEKGDSHYENHWNHGQAVKESDDKGYRTPYFSKNSQYQRSLASEAERVREGVDKLGVVG